MNSIEVKNVTKSYADHKALNQVSLVVPTGCVFGLLGPNGAGKTTLIRIINQIIAPDSGQIHFYGSPIERKHIYEIGYLPEERGLYKKMKVGEQAIYLAMLKGLKRKEAIQVLKPWFEKFDLTLWWNKKVEDLSKGMAQKVQFITTVVHNPKLLILDEPFSGFDPINAQLVRDEIKRLKKEGCTIILSTHNMASVEEICEYIALINQSQKVLDGKVSDLKKQYAANQFKLSLEEFKEDDWQQAVNGKFQLLESAEKEGTNTLKVQLSENANLNDLVSSVINYGQLKEVIEEVPTMDEIFIQTVKGGKSNG